MGLFDKLKNIFIEEEEIESEESYKSIPKKIEVKEETKKEEVVKEIPQITKEDVVSDRDLIETNQKFKFPIIFEEDDFKEERKKSKSINVLERENTKYEPEIKREVKPQKKTFKPSPVISPVYGVLDKNYTKDEISSKDGLLTDSEDKVDIDYVIKKAYGNQATTREEKNKENQKESDEIIDLFKDKLNEGYDEEYEDYEEDDFNNEELSNQVDEKIKSIDDLLKDTNDDFYSLVDSMYKDEEGDEKE